MCIVALSHMVHYIPQDWYCAPSREIISYYFCDFFFSFFRDYVPRRVLVLYSGFLFFFLPALQ